MPEGDASAEVVEGGIPAERATDCNGEGEDRSEGCKTRAQREAGDGQIGGDQGGNGESSMASRRKAARGVVNRSSRGKTLTSEVNDQKDEIIP